MRGRPRDRGVKVNIHTVKVPGGTGKGKVIGHIKSSMFERPVPGGTRHIRELLSRVIASTRQVIRVNDVLNRAEVEEAITKATEGHPDPDVRRLYLEEARRLIPK